MPYRISCNRVIIYPLSSVVNYNPKLSVISARLEIAPVARAIAMSTTVMTSDRINTQNLDLAKFFRFLFLGAKARIISRIKPTNGIANRSSYPK